MVTPIKTKAEIKALRAAFEKQQTLVGTFVYYEGGQRKTMAGFEEQQDRAIEAKRKWRFALGYTQ